MFNRKGIIIIYFEQNNIVIKLYSDKIINSYLGGGDVMAEKKVANTQQETEKKLNNSSKKT